MNINNPIIINYIRSYQAETFKVGSQEIGIWDMDADTTKIVTLDVTGFAIRSIYAQIYNDDQDTLYNLEMGTTAFGQSGKVEIQTSLDEVWLYRTPAGFFDAATFDSGVINRGYITYWYIE